MERAFRAEILRRAPARLARRTVLAGLAREYTLEEIVIVTRAGPARTLGLTRKGHFGAGADGDVALLRDAGDAATTFAVPVAVFKDGVLVAREGEIVATPPGRTFHAAPRPGLAAGQERFAALLPEAFAASHSWRWRLRAAARGAGATRDDRRGRGLRREESRGYGDRRRRLLRNLRRAVRATPTRRP